MQISDEMVEAFGNAFWSVNAASKIDGQRDHIRSALEAALSTDAEPVKPLHENDAVWARFYRDGKNLGEICSEFKCGVYDLSPWLTAPLMRAAPPAPAVAVKVKPLEWKEDGKYLRARMGDREYMLSITSDGETWAGITRPYVFGYNGNWGSVPNCSFVTLEAAKAACQADCQARHEALSAQVQDVAEERNKICERCQGNGEIVTDWERYRHPHENDVGDEAVAECPDCDGIGKITAQEGWQLVPKEHTPEMEDAYRKAHGAKCVDIASNYPTEHPDDGGGPFGYGYRAMLAAAPTAKQGEAE